MFRKSGYPVLCTVISQQHAVVMVAKDCIGQMQVSVWRAKFRKLEKPRMLVEIEGWESLRCEPELRR
jgi:hypothetical protein